MTLAALIVTLGMIVDNSIVIIDSYLERLSEGMSRWHASIESTIHFFKSILSATLAISITFFPFLMITVGLVHDFLLSFPWAISLILAISLLVAVLLVPFMQFYFIRKPIAKKQGTEKYFSFLDTLQSFYDKVLALCFAYPKTVVAIGIISVVIGSVMLARQPQSMLPTADRNQFAVEIYMPTGTSIEKTAMVADSLERIIRKDERVVSVTSFKGCNSPRFHSSYAPQIPGSNFAQFIVNTKGVKETVEILDELAPKYTNYFPEATIKFKQFNGGILKIEAKRGADKKFIGHASIRDFNLHNTPVLARVLSVASLTGIVGMLSGEGIAFSHFDAPFEYKNKILSVKDGRAFGNVLGITMSGQYNWGKEEVEGKGVIAPAYSINSFLGRIPLVGNLLAGKDGTVFAANYSVKGKINDVKVNINPLSALSPGSLKDLFSSLFGSNGDGTN